MFSRPLWQCVSVLPGAVRFHPVLPADSQRQPGDRYCRTTDRVLRPVNADVLPPAGQWFAPAGNGLSGHADVSAGRPEPVLVVQSILSAF